MDKKKIRILLVDDEESLREGLRVYLELEGYEVDTAPNGEEALSLGISNYDLLLLDIMMDGISGTELARSVRLNPETAGVPIIFLTAKDSDDDMIYGLRLGADDYIAKPYSPRNVVARIEAVLRRSFPAGLKSSEGVVCDRESLTCTVDGHPVRLTRKEFEILALLLGNPGRIFSRDEILGKIWPENVVVVDRSVDVHVTRLRGKIAPYGKNIVTRSGYGYGWEV